MAVEDFHAQSGLGCRGRVGAHQVLLGSERWMAANGVQVPQQAEQHAEHVAGAGVVAASLSGGIVSTWPA